MADHDSSLRSIYEVMQYGPIIAGEPAMGWLITVGSSQMNLWVEVTGGLYRPIDSNEMSFSLHGKTLRDVIKLSEKWLKEIHEFNN